LSIGIPKETFPNERRVAIVPATVQTLVKKGFTVNVEEGAGVEASFANKEYEAAGAKVTNAANVYKSNILLKVRWVGLFVFGSLDAPCCIIYNIIERYHHQSLRNGSMCTLCIGKILHIDCRSMLCLAGTWARSDVAEGYFI